MILANYIPTNNDQGFDLEVCEWLWEAEVALHPMGAGILEWWSEFVVVWATNSWNGIQFAQNKLQASNMTWKDLQSIVKPANEIVFAYLGLDALQIFRGVPRRSLGTATTINVRRLSSWSSDLGCAKQLAVGTCVYQTAIKSDGVLLTWHCNSLLRETMQELEVVVMVDDEKVDLQATICWEDDNA